MVTDHFPLTTLLKQAQKSTGMAAARIQRWRLLLAEYDFVIVFAKGTSISDADALSRLPLPAKTEDCDQVNYFSPLDQVPITSWTVQEETKKDPLLPRIIELTKRGWPKKVDDPDFIPFFQRREALSTD